MILWFEQYIKLVRMFFILYYKPWYFLLTVDVHIKFIIYFY